MLILFRYLTLHSFCLIFYFPQTMIQKLPPSLGFEDRKSSGTASESDPLFSSWLVSMKWECFICIQHLFLVHPEAPPALSYLQTLI